MKYEGDLIITEENKNDFTELTEVTGGLEIYADAQLPVLQTVGGWLCIRTDVQLPALQTVGGWLYIYADAQLPALQVVGRTLYINADVQLPALQAVGGELDINADAQLPALQTVRGGINIKADAQLPALQTVGGWLKIRADAQLPVLQTVGGWMEIKKGIKFAADARINAGPEAKKAAVNFTRECFLKNGWLLADGILAKIIKKKKNVYKIQICGNNQISYCIEADGVFSHGDTIKEAKESLIYKISNRDTSQYEGLKLSDTVSFADAVKMYRCITGACEAGTRHFVESVLKDKKEKYKISEIIELTAGQYGADDFKKFFEK